MVQGQTRFLLQALKAGREKVAMILYGSFGNIWEKEEVPSYWKKPLRKGILQSFQKGKLSICVGYRGMMHLSELLYDTDSEQQWTPNFEKTKLSSDKTEYVPTK